MTAARYRNPNAQWLGSPNYSPARDGHDLTNDPRYIVMHTMVGSMASANGRFQQAAQQASAHYGVGLDGRLVQWVDEGDASWAAGNYQVNLDAINIEHEDGGNYNSPRPAALKETSAQLLAGISRRYGLPLDRSHVKLHREVSLSPTACPDSLEVDEILNRANVILHPPAPVPAPAPVVAPEWKANLHASAQTFLLAKPVTLVDIASKAAVRQVSGKLDVAYETSAGGAAYWMTQYAVDHGTGDGISKAEVAAAVEVRPVPVPVPEPAPEPNAPPLPTPAPTPPPTPPPDNVTVLPPPEPPAGFWGWLQRFVRWLSNR